MKFSVTLYHTVFCTLCYVLQVKQQKSCVAIWSEYCVIDAMIYVAQIAHRNAPSQLIWIVPHVYDSLSRQSLKAQIAQQFAFCDLLHVDLSGVAPYDAMPCLGGTEARYLRQHFQNPVYLHQYAALSHSKRGE